MRKEIIGIVLFFLVVFTIISLLSFSPSDPSFNNASAAGEIHNLFGLVGAYTAGLFIGLFGLGAFWIPVLLLLSSLHFFGGHSRETVIATLVGGLILTVTTGSLLSLAALPANHFVLFGSRFSSGGLVGIPLQSLLVTYSNATGACIILVVLWVIGLVLTTGVSVIRMGKRIWIAAAFVYDRVATLVIKWRQRRKKARKRLAVQKVESNRKPRQVKIKTPEPKPMVERPAPKQEVFDFMRTKDDFQPPVGEFSRYAGAPTGHGRQGKPAHAVPASGEKAPGFRCFGGGQRCLPGAGDHHLRVRAGAWGQDQQNRQSHR